MDINTLKKQIEHTLDKVIALKEKYITEQLGTVDYVGLTSPNLALYLESIQAAIVYSDQWGDLYRLTNPIHTVYGDITLIKISRPAPDGFLKPYADFQTDIYPELFVKYATKPNFITMHGDNWELIGIEDSNAEVNLYIPNRPLSLDI